MDPTTGKLFGAISPVAADEDTPAFRPGTADPDYSRWYTQQWLKSYRHETREPAAEAPPASRAA